MDIAGSRERLKETMENVNRIMRSWRVGTEDSVENRSVTDLARELNDCQERAARIAVEAYDELSGALCGSDEVIDLNEKTLEDFFAKQPSMIEVANLMKTSVIIVEVISNLSKAVRCTDAIDVSRSSDLSDFLRIYGEMLEILDTFGLDEDDD